jgi:hypothetical protein
MLEFLAELVLQLGSEGAGSFFQIAWLKMTGRERKVSTTSEWVWTFCTGLITGLLTLLIFPELTLRQPWMQIANLIAAPLVAGLLIERYRAWRESRGVFHWEVFGHAAVFGLVFALTRFVFAH